VDEKASSTGPTSHKHEEGKLRDLLLRRANIGKGERDEANDVRDEASKHARNDAKWETW